MNCTGRLHAAGGVGYKHAGVLLSLLPCSTAAPEVPSFTARCLPAGTPGALQHAAVGAAETMRSLSSQKHRISLGKPWCHASAAAEGGDEPRGRARCALRPSGEQEQRLGPLRWGCWWSRAVFRAHQSVGEQVKGLPRRCFINFIGEMESWGLLPGLVPVGCVKGCETIPPPEFPSL